MLGRNEPSIRFFLFTKMVSYKLVPKASDRLSANPWYKPSTGG